MITFERIAALAELAPQYRALRQARPEIPARDVHRYLNSDEGYLTIDQFLCAHTWGYSGTAYGGDDESYHGEGRAYCLNCGMDGDS